MSFSEKPPDLEQKERPSILYHASPNSEIAEFEPRNQTVRHPDEGPVIFATPDKAAAIKNLFPSNDTWTQMGRVNGVHFILIAKDREEFTQKDRGGSLYALPADSFTDDPKYKGTAKSEWTSREKVKPLSQEDLPSALEAMIAHGVQVYFVDPSILKEFRDAPDKVTVLQRLTSENQRRGEHVRLFDDSM